MQKAIEQLVTEEWIVLKYIANQITLEEKQIFKSLDQKLVKTIESRLESKALIEYRASRKLESGLVIKGNPKVTYYGKQQLLWLRERE